eukprot:Rmarinus@m.9086
MKFTALSVLAALAWTVHAESKAPGWELTNGPLPNLEHKFAEPEVRTNEATSFAFAVAALAPLAVLLISWLAVGANIRGFPVGAVSLPALVFQGCIAGLGLLYALFFIQINLFQTLAGLAVLTVVGAVTGQPTLRALAEASQKSE